MCGIFAYLNYDTSTNNKEIVATLVAALKVLALRGYDSVGIGVEDTLEAENTKFDIYKTAGTVEKLEKLITDSKIEEKELRNSVNIAHTRWATHGVVSNENAHPLTSDSSNEFMVVHNGMINNYLEIKDMLTKNGVTFSTETDTEVVVKLAQFLYNKDKSVTFGALIRAVCKHLQGAFALAFASKHYPHELVVTSYGSNLFLGVNMYDRSPPPEPRKNNKIGISISRTDSRSSLLELARASSSTGGINKAEYFISSDPAALTDHTKTCIHLEDGDLLHFRNGRYQYYNTKEDKTVDKKSRPVQATGDSAKVGDKGKYAHFMLKEIHEQPDAIRNVMRGRVDFEKNFIKLGGIETHLEEIRFARRIAFIASASSYHASVATRELFEELTGLAVTLELSTDFLDRSPAVERNDVCVFISQSGETADVIKALQYCKSRHALCIGITNAVGSTLSKNTDCGVYLNCGPEFGVVSTKGYTCQIIALTLMALKIGENTSSTLKRRIQVIQGLKALPDFLTKALASEDHVSKLSEKIANQSSVLVMGRGYHYATCLEGAFKLKEISNLHSEGVLSGELKHGPLALVDENMPIVFVVTKDENYDKTRSSFSQVIARSGSPIILCSEGDDIIPTNYDRVELPTTVDCLQCVINIVPLQLLSYHAALKRGLDIDHHKSLAKVVIV